MKDGLPEQQESALELSNEHLEAIAASHGNLKLAWQQLAHAGQYNKSYRQFLRAVKALPPVLRVGLVEGVVPGLQQGLYLQSQDVHRLDRVIFDHTEADIRLQRTYAGRLEMFRPWVSLLIDAATRVILAGTVTVGDGIKGDPNTETLVALMASCIRGYVAADGTFVGGKPRLVQCDNAKAHMAEAMLSGFTTLGIAGSLIKPGTPWEDGKVERLMRTFNNEFLKPLPGYTAATSDRYNHAAWKPEDCLTLDEFRLRFEQWIDAYNFDRKHSALGCTPFERWRDDPTVIERVDEALIRSAFLASSKPRTVDKNGVMFEKVHYTHPDLAHVRGKKVTVRYLPNDRTFVDVYCEGQFVCTAVPHARLTKDQRITIVRERSAQGRKVDVLVKRSRKRRAERAWTENPFLGPQRDADGPAPVAEEYDEDEVLLQRAEELAQLRDEGRSREGNEG